MVTTAQCMGDVIEEMLGDIKDVHYEEMGRLYPFKVRVGCVRRRPPRHPYFEYLINMGRSDVERVLSHEPLTKETLTFIFPERWMGVAEQQAFMSILCKHPDVEKIKQMDMITSSPLLIGNFMRDMIRILSWPDDDKYGCGNGA